MYFVYVEMYKVKKVMRKELVKKPFGKTYAIDFLMYISKKIKNKNFK